MRVNIEVTDTFNGEANYAWIKRQELNLIDCMSDYSVVRRVKKEIGWGGQRTSTVKYNDVIELRPYGVCQVCFITFEGAS